MYMNSKCAGPAAYTEFLAQVSPFLDPHTVRDAAVFDYGQWDLPFEAVLIAVMEKPRNQVRFDFNRAARLAEAANTRLIRVLSGQISLADLLAGRIYGNRAKYTRMPQWYRMTP
ncbi:hypothetical protein [Agrobacterium pusense]|uniref:Uncharacterized protein n=1 Tax=Agrobacterium pusense TaxID=648995 RepID=A0AA44IXL5_9HYPH|nr:hypothetical protein [Agrobacterium pusense]NRF18487.1 hypothetical protein [Agrobacterium pusense]